MNTVEKALAEIDLHKKTAIANSADERELQARLLDRIEDILRADFPEWIDEIDAEIGK